jgi:hypothetical protein
VCGSGFGTVIFAPLTQYLIAEYKWQGTLLVISGITFFCAVFGYMFRPLNLDEYDEKEQQQLVEVPNEKNGKHTNNINNNNSDNIKYKAPENTNLLSPNSHQQIIRSHSFGNGALNGNSVDKNSDERTRLAMSLSQPLLNDGKAVIRSAGSGTLDRPDAFYTGSLHNIAHHRSHHSIHTEDRYGSLKRRENNEEIDDEREKFCGCIPCSRETHDTIKKMMSFALLKDPIFLLFVFSNFLTR